MPTAILFWELVIQIILWPSLRRMNSVIKKRIIPMLNRTILQGYMVCLTQTVFAKLK